jgi:DNA-3-methyladenine glycosylase II
MFLEPIPPYAFDLNAGYITRFRGVYGADSYVRGTFRRLLTIDEQPVLVSVRDAGTLDSPSLELELEGETLGGDRASEVRRLTERMLGTGDDLSAFYRAAESDTHLDAIVQGLRGLHVARSPTVFEALVVAILGQQISFHVAAMLRLLLVQTYGESVCQGGATYYAFPSPQALAAAGVGPLRACKLSARKAEYIVGIASDVVSGDLDLEGLRGESSQTVVKALTGIRGVGAWTAQWLLIRALGYADGFPSGDLALQRTMGLMAKGGTPMTTQEAETYSLRWSPYRSYVTTYLFAAARSGILPALASSADTR